jgi:16S rRNA (guanine527-N7)-methyltransferase
MDPGRIAQLLKPFLELPARDKTPQEPCHSEPHAAERSDARASEESAFLSPKQLHKISTYIDLLLHWNARINLTAVRQPEEIVTRHFGESLFAARHLFPGGTSAEAGFRPGQERSFALPMELGSHHPETVSARASANDQPPTADDVVDVGSGAGFPGLPIKIWAPHIHLTLIESNQKKSTFLREVARSLTLTNVDVFSARAEEYTIGSADVVTLRAVEHFETALPIAARLIAPSGRMAILVGSAQADAAPRLTPALSWSPPRAIPLSARRILLTATNK